VPRSHVSSLLILAVLAVVTYLPALQLPLLEDDYPNISQARDFAAGGWSGMVDHPLFRYRATSYLLFSYTYNWFGINPVGFHAACIALHLLAVWLLYALGVWPLLGYRLAFFGAAFFAVYEGHQEAVMWVSACNELLAFLFGAASLVAWVHFLQSEKRRVLFYIGSLAAFFCSLISKESAVVFAALMVLPVLFSEKRRLRDLVWLTPFASMAAAVVAMILATRGYSFRFQDGSFSLAAPFWLTLPNSFARLFWFWGLLSVVALIAWRAFGRWRRVLTVGILWIVVSLLPYSFLTYMTRVPSRQTYLASAALAWIVGAAFVELSGRWGASRRALLWAVAAAVLAHNIGYIWTRKYYQFRRRAEPTEQLIALAGRVEGPIYIRCFPRPRIVAEEAVRLAAGMLPEELIWDEKELRSRRPAAVFCYREFGK